MTHDYWYSYLRKVDLLDVAAPYELFNWMKESVPGVEVYLIAKKPGNVTTLNGLTLRV